jgi:hypothetical protein
MAALLRRLLGASTISLVVLANVGACSSSSPPAVASVTDDQAEATRQRILAVIAQDARFTDPTPLTHDDYQALADAIAKVPGVEGASYSGDGLGSIRVGILGGGTFEWIHVTDDVAHAEQLPGDFDFAQLNDETNNAGFTAPEVVSHPRAGGTYATHFPNASIDPDPEYVADDAVKGTCPIEGSIALVDLYYDEVHPTGKLYTKEFDIDGKEIWDRLEMMGKAAGFTVDVYKHGEVKLSNFVGILGSHTYVVVNGHGMTPGPVNIDRTHEAMLTIITPEKYVATNTLEDGKTYEAAWKLGWINRGLQHDDVRWTPRLIQGEYAPKVPQVWLLSTCHALKPRAYGFVWADDSWSFRWAAVGGLYNFGDALREKHVPAVFGYANAADVWAVAGNLMAFFRRQFGGYFDQDRPPSPLSFWPTCMSVQTYFRRHDSPAKPIYANKLDGKSLFTMYAESDPLYLRQTCQSSPANVHSTMQDFVLSVGTPATAFQSCWDRYWSQGKAATFTQDALCSKGDFPTAEAEVVSAGCNVLYARKATNAMLP